MSFSITLLSFFIYSFIGWLYESTLCSLINQHKFVNRGFLYGPYCPIYGTGAIVCWFSLKNITNAFLIFILSVIICSVLEYLTSFIMEKLFNQRWWDYSNLPLNINGRVCLFGGILFGLAVVVEVTYIQPNLIANLSQFNASQLILLSIILCSIFIIDFFLTVSKHDPMKYKSILNSIFR